MKRIAALSLVAAMAATGALADDAKPTVSTQAPPPAPGLSLTAIGPAGIVGAIVAVSIIVAAADESSTSASGT